MARLPRERRLGREPGGRSLRGATPAQRSRIIDQGGLLQAPSIVRYGGPVPELRRLPSLVDLKKLDTAGLGAVLDRYGITEPWAQLRAAQVGYLNRLSRYPEGSEQYNAELERLLDINSKTGALMAARRAYREYAAMSFDKDAILVRICEDDESSCETCVKLGGFEGTVEEQRAVGWAGAASCKGGERCRCEYGEVKQ